MRRVLNLQLVVMLFFIFSANAVVLFEIKDEAGYPVFIVDSQGVTILNNESKALGDTLMTISSRSIKAFVGNSGKALSRTFSVSTTSSKGPGTNVLEVGTGNTVMREGTGGGDYSNFSPENIFLGLNAGINTVPYGENNVFLGNNSGYSNGGGNNVFIGTESGYSSTSTYQNTYVGYRSGYLLTGAANSVYGSMAGENAGGNNNTFIGNSAGAKATEGSNVFVGGSAGYNFDFNNTGRFNTYIGENSGSCTTSGYYNVAMGFNTGRNNNSGSNNTLIGYEAGKGYYGTSYSSNSFFGYQSGFSNRTGSFNSYVGQGAGYNNTTGSRNVLLGYNAGYNVTGSDRLYIANSSTTTPLIYGHFPNNYLALNADSVKVRALVSGSGNAVYRNATTGLLVASSSDIRLKENISPLKNSLEKVSKLQGVTYSWKSDEKHEKKIGLIAQDVEKVLPELVFTNETDGYKGINYAEITAVLTEAVKEQQKIIDKLTERLNEVEKKLNDK